MDRYRLSKTNPFAPPDRRFRLAKKCLQAGILPSFHDDLPTREVFRFMRKRRAAVGHLQRTQVTNEYPGLSIAFELHQGKARILRPVIEAYILADADDDAIAARLAVLPEAVHWYRAAFYDVEHLRHARLHVCHRLIGILDEEGQSVSDPHRWWKLIGYQGKYEALDQLFGIDNNPNAPQDGGLKAWTARQVQSAFQLKHMIAMHSLDVHDPKHLELLLSLGIQEQHGRRDSDRVPLNQYDESVKALMEQIPWSFGASGEEAFKNTEIGKYDESAVELRADELLQLAGGANPPGLDEKKDFKFPPPRKPNPHPGQNDGGEILK